MEGAFLASFFEGKLHIKEKKRHRRNTPPAPFTARSLAGALGSWLAGHFPGVLVWTGACYYTPRRRFFFLE